MKKPNRKCKECARFNDFGHTYIEDDGRMDCCSRWHTAYHKWENKGERHSCEEFEDMKRVVQLSLF